MKTKNIFFIIYALLLVCNTGYAIYIHSPPGGSLGDSREPFFSPCRFQQVYRASDFNSIGLNGGYITKIGFTSDVYPGIVLSNVQINLSTTLHGPDQLSPVFSENIGADQTTVYGPKSLRIVGEANVGISITLDHPFYYNPYTENNLLLEIKNAHGYSNPFGGGPYIDVVTANGDSSSSIYAFDMNATTATWITSDALWTHFTMETVPEPSGFYLLLSGIVMILVLKFSKRARNVC